MKKKRGRKAQDEGGAGSPKKRKVVSRETVEESESEDETLEELRGLREDVRDGGLRWGQLHEEGLALAQENQVLLLRAVEALEYLVEAERRRNEMEGDWFARDRYPEEEPERPQGPEDAEGSKGKGKAPENGPEDVDETQK